MDMSRKTLRKTTGRNMGWGVFKTYADSTRQVGGGGVIEPKLCKLYVNYTFPLIGGHNISDSYLTSYY